jgi:hypothetical protein
MILIVNEITSAYCLQKTFGKALLQDEKFKTLLRRLDQNIETTQKEMVATGVVNTEDIENQIYLCAKM